MGTDLRARDSAAVERVLPIRSSESIKSDVTRKENVQQTNASVVRSSGNVRKSGLSNEDEELGQPSPSAHLPLTVNMREAGSVTTSGGGTNFTWVIPGWWLS